jgi:hypothetical protein
MIGWWVAVFWILLIPLVAVEIIVYLKSKKFFWLIFALAIFTYVIAVCYTIDAFDAGKNTIILTLLGSAALMFLVGRQLGKKNKKQKRASKGMLWAIAALGALIIIVFTFSVIFGKLVESTTPVSSVEASKIQISSPKTEGPYPAADVKLMTTVYKNTFFMPVPVKQEYYRVCLYTTAGPVQLSQVYTAQEQFPEIAAGETKSVDFKVNPNQLYDPNSTSKPEKIVIYMTTMLKQWEPCDNDPSATPLYTIPVI